MTTFGDLANILPSDEEDEDDEEYVPSDEGESSSDEEEEVIEETDESGNKAKRKATKEEVIPRKKRRGFFEGSTDETASSPKSTEEGVETDVERPKDTSEKNSQNEGSSSCSDTLWMNFLKRSGRPVKRENESTKIQRTRVLEFAGETIKVTEEVSVRKEDKSSKSESKTDGKDGSVKDVMERLRPTPDESKTSEDTPSASSSVNLKPQGFGAVANGIAKKPGGVASLLSNLNKKSKLTVLEKSKLDWQTFKTAEGIDDDLKIHNRGKDGYLEKIAFLERADYRQFELERDIRQGAKRNKRE